MKAIWIVLVLLMGCDRSAQGPAEIVDRDRLHDRVLGSLVGSAYGDAMGASTEMWSRADRIATYGHISGFKAPEIDPSAEGVWDRGYPEGATTDDTRWKALVGTYVATHGRHLRAKSFAEHVVSAFDVSVRQNDGTDLAQRKDDWLVEWADVARAYLTGSPDTYAISLSRFYGGDLLCAGMLYSPALALPYAGDPMAAYDAAFSLSLFDQGYARDISALTAAMTAAAMAADATPESILAVFDSVDPHGFSNRRIFSRYAVGTRDLANNLATQAVGDDATLFRLLDQHNEWVAPHAREILLVALTAMIHTGFDFHRTMEFITNYGRDNDTSAAVAGAILGAYHGFSRLPSAKQTVMRVARETHDIDLELLATQIVDRVWPTSTPPDPTILKLSEDLLSAVKRREPTDSIRSVIAGLDPGRFNDGLTDNTSRKVVWLNLYNAYFQLAELSDSVFITRQIPIAGKRYSFDQIEHEILRKAGLMPDYRIHFALNCGAASCPPILFYRYDTLDAQLDQATSVFIKTDAQVDEAARTLTVTQLMQWYSDDFGGDEGIRQVVGTILNRNLSGYKLLFEPFDWTAKPMAFVD